MTDRAFGEPVWLGTAGEAVRLRALVGPHAGTSEIIGVQHGARKIKRQAQPIEGKANEALPRFLAARLGLPRKAIQLAQGAPSRQKAMLIEGLDPETIKGLLLPQA